MNQDYHKKLLKSTKSIDKVTESNYNVNVINRKRGENMINQLTQKDIKEGEEIYEILARLPDEERKQALIYVRALGDRQIMTSEKKAG